MVTGTSCAALSGGSGIVAAKVPLSSSDAEEVPLASLDCGPVELCPIHVVGPDRIPVDPDPALVDHPAPVTRRLAEDVRQELRQVHHGFGVADLLDLLRRLALPDDPREVLLGPSRRLLAVGTRDDPPRE